MHKQHLEKHILLENPVVTCTGVPFDVLFCNDFHMYSLTSNAHFFNQVIRVIAVQNLPPAAQPLI